MSDVVLVSFWGAFAIDIVIVLYALRLSRAIGGSGLLNNVIMLTAASAFVFGVHHVLEIVFQDSEGGLAFAEGVEGIAAVLLGFGVYQFYRLVRGD